MKYLIVIFTFLISVICFADEKNSIAVMPFTSVGTVYKSVTESIQFKMEHFLVKEGAELVSRTRMDQIIEEQKLSLTGLVDSKKAVELGKILSAEKLVTGYVQKKGNKYYVLAQLIDVKSGKIENSVYTETSSNDMFFNESIKAMAKELAGTKKDSKSIKKEAKEEVKKEDKNNLTTEKETKEEISKVVTNNEITIAEKKINVNKISFDYLGKDRFVGQYCVINSSGESSIIKGEIYVNDEVFDIYKKDGEQYPSITEDVMSILPCENSVILINGKKTRITQKLNDIYIKNDKEKYMLGNYEQIIYINRVDDLEQFLKMHNISQNDKIDAVLNNELSEYVYNIEKNSMELKSEKADLPEKLVIEAFNFSGEVDKKDIEVIYPANFKIKLKNGYTIEYFDPEKFKVVYNDKKNFTIICNKDKNEECKNELIKTFDLLTPENPFFIDKINEPGIKRELESYEDERWKMLDIKSLYLENKQIKDISALKGLKGLRTLVLKYNNISDVSSLKELLDLRYLNLTGNKIVDFNNFLPLLRLESLDLSENGIMEIDGIEKIWWLEDLGLAQNRIFDITVLEKMKNLKSLDLRKSRVEDLTPISKLSNLEKLDLTEDQLFYNIAPLLNLKKLKILMIGRTSVQDISEIKKLENLEKINIASTQIVNIESLKSLKFLNYMNLSGTATNSSSFKTWSFNGDIEIWNVNSYTSNKIKRDEKEKYGIKDGNLVYSYD